MSICHKYEHTKILHPFRIKNNHKIPRLMKEFIFYIYEPRFRYLFSRIYLNIGINYFSLGIYQPDSNQIYFLLKFLQDQIRIRAKINLIFL